MTRWLLAPVVSLATSLTAEETMKLTSPQFDRQQPIPTRHSGEGVDVSPALAWVGAPAETRSFALVCDDPDAMSVAGKVWDHWVIWNIPPTASGLPENVARTETVAALGGARQGMNTWPRLGYHGPMPPPGHGVHHYHFKLYALDRALDLPARSTKAALETAMRGHILAEAELIGTYEHR